MEAMTSATVVTPVIKQTRSRQVDVARTTAIEMTLTHVRNTTILALIELGVFDTLAAGNRKLTAHEIARFALPEAKAVNVRNLERMLRVMVAYRIITESTSETGSRCYELSPVGKFFAKNEDDDDVDSAVWAMQWGESPALHAFTATRVPLMSFVLEETSEPQTDHHPLYSEFLVQNPSLRKLFNSLNNANSKYNNPRILDAYQGFKGVSVLVDVGGGYGAMLKAVIARHPNVRGINFDVPQVIAECPPLPGVEHVSGDMLESVPSGGDAIFIKWILHNWDDESCLKVLKNCWAALPTGGKVIVVEMVTPEVIDPDNCDRAMFLLDIMMMQLARSRERTENDFRELGLAAGFSQVNVACQMHSVGTIFEMLKA